MSNATSRLDVWLDGQPAPLGQLRRDVGVSLSFAYAPDYTTDPDAVPLSVRLPLRREPYGDREARAFFDNLLPEGEPRDAIAAKHRLDTGDVVGLLAILGADAPGAVSVLPAGAPPAKSPGHLGIDYASMSEADLAEAVAASATGRPPAEKLHFSLAGVQSKFALAVDDGGRFLVPLGGAPSTHIVKVERTNARERGVVANEFACLELCRRLGLPTVGARRVEIAGTPCLITPRYDRRRSAEGLVGRLHQEDAAQVLGIDRSLKYEARAIEAGRKAGLTELFGGFAGACRSPVDARDVLFRATFVNWLVGNSDAHMKNFALVHEPAGLRIAGLPLSPMRALAPIYDVVCVAAYPDFSHDYAMRIGADYSWSSVEREHWEHLARLAFGARSRTAVRRGLERLRAIAATALPALDAMVEERAVGRRETKSIRDVIGQRLRHLEATMGWDVSADTDEPIVRGGGWAMS